MKNRSSRSSIKLGKELHDGVCQTLTGIHFQLSMLTDKVKKMSPECGAEMEDLGKLMARARAELHTILVKLPR